MQPQLTPQIQTLNAVDAHQAIAGLVMLYTGIVADAQRQQQILMGQVATLSAEVERLKKELSALQSPHASEK